MIATFEQDTLTINAGNYTLALTVKQVENAWNSLSHFPDRRARLELGALAERLTAFGDHVERLTALGGKLDQAAELERFASRHVSLTRRAWALDSRCMSWFIVGPSKFPTDRNRKKMDSADNGYKIVRDHLQTAKRAVDRITFPHGMPGDAIRANNPDAPELIRAEIEKHRTAHARMKAANAAIRSVKHGDVDAMVQAVVDATGWRDTIARRVVVPPQSWMGRGFEAYQLTAALAEIKRLEDRLKQIETNRERGTISTMHGDVELIENGDAARIQLIFPGKPDATVRDVLKANGFRWAPSENAWQRHLNNNGRYAAKRVLDTIARPS